MNKEEQNKWVRKYLRHGFWRRLVALTLALVTWTGLRMMLMTHRNISLKVRVEYDTEKFFITSDHLENALNVRVDAVGGSTVDDGIDDVSNYDLYVTLNPSSQDQKNIVFTLNDIKTRKLPRGVTLSQITPASFTVPFDTIVTKEVRLKEPPEIPLGYKKLTFSKLPTDTVKLKGPSQYIHDITELTLDIARLNRDKLQEKAASRLSLNVQNPYPTLERRLIIEPATIEVDTKLEEVVRDSELTLQRPLQCLMCPDGLQVASPKMHVVTVILRGRRDIIEKLEEKTVLAYVNLGGIKEPAKTELPVQIGGIPNAIHYELSPQSVSVELRQLPSTEASTQPQQATETGTENK